MKIKDLISDKLHWSVDAMYRDAKGKRLPSTSLYVAKRFSLSGASIRCYNEGPRRDEASRRLREAITEYCGLTGIDNFNDSMMWEDIKIVLERADV